MNADPETMRYFPSTLSPQESDAALEKITNGFEKHGFGRYAAELKSTGEFVGVIGLSVPAFEAAFTPCVEIGWRLVRQYWNQGFTTEGALSVLLYAFEDLGLPEIVSFTAVPNLPSQRVMEKIGMTHDPADDFDHPILPEGHWLKRHVLYRKKSVAVNILP